MTLRLIRSYLGKLPQRTRSIMATCVYGLAAGGAAVAFQLGINYTFNTAYGGLAHQSTKIFLAGSFAVIMGSSLLVGFLLDSFCPAASGSGIPQLKLAFWKDFGFIPWRVVWVKFVAGIVSIGGGASLGREGPSVHFAGGLASNVAGWMGEPKQNRRNAAAAGAAAGLAAAFNTPLAAITFVLEEIIEDLNSRFLGSVLLASVIGALVVHGLVGKQPAFSLASNVEPSSWWIYILTPIVAAASSAVGLVFQKSALGLRAQRKQFTRVPGWMRPAMGGFITWVLGSIVFLNTGSLGVFGLGYSDLSEALSKGFDWHLAGILVLVKLVTTVACYGFGGCGGIFSPMLFLGGMTGVFFAGVSGELLHLTAADQIVLAVVGMSTCLGAVVRAPVTSILIVFEMTHQFSLVPVLMLGTLVSQAIRHRVAKHNFYEALLIQDGHVLERVIPPRDLQSWQQLPVSAIANFRPVILQDLAGAELRKVLQGHPYRFFPVMISDKPQMLSRKEVEAALTENRAPRVEPAITCLPTQTIRDLQMLLVEAQQAVVLVLDAPGGKILGLVTLHDLLRAQVSLGRETNQGGI